MDMLESLKLKENLKKLKNKEFQRVLLLLFIGILMPSIANLTILPINKYLYSSALNTDQGSLMMAAFLLVLMNSIRILPIYTATFIIMEIIHKNKMEYRKNYIFIGMTILLVPFMYKLIDLIYGIEYHFGVPSVIVIIAMVFSSVREMKYVSVAKKSLFIIIFLMGVQWLDLMPFLSDYGFGKGEISRDIKNISSIINGDGILTFISCFLFGIFSVNSYMMYIIFDDQNKALIDLEVRREMRKELHEARINQLKIRSLEEAQNLVHDLKTPLTAIQLYVSLIEMLDLDEKSHKYVNKITSSLDQLNHMISEILQTDKKRVITVNELFNYILAQLSIYDLIDVLDVKITCPDSEVSVNKIRMSRAVINIVKNSLDSMDKETPVIKLTVEKRENVIFISIIDNGKGITSQTIEKIWERGFSTKGSFGIGLEFVKSVVENHSGSIDIYSEIGVKTEVNIMIPECAKTGGNQIEEDINNR